MLEGCRALPGQISAVVLTRLGGGAHGQGGGRSGVLPAQGTLGVEWRPWPEPAAVSPGPRKRG